MRYLVLLILSSVLLACSDSPSPPVAKTPSDAYLKATFRAAYCEYFRTQSAYSGHVPTMCSILEEYGIELKPEWFTEAQYRTVVEPNGNYDIISFRTPRGNRLEVKVFHSEIEAKNKSEQDVALQSATRSESKSEGNLKSKPESKELSQ